MKTSRLKPKRDDRVRSPALLGAVEPDPISQVLGTGYMRFQSPNGLCGLGKWTHDRLDLLAVHASRRGVGQFRDFIAAAKRQWKTVTVCVWKDWNPIMGEALARYGFSRETEIERDGETITGWRWDRPPNAPSSATRPDRDAGAERKHGN